ncbi:MAG: endo-1,4-beta-xylanase [Clostridia bacterium]|nr:endo-1,4-beta-xylanase [Clostridia bacterium]
MSAYRDYLHTGRTDLIPSLKDFYADDFRMGVAVAPQWLFRPECDGAVRKHFSSITAENVMKPECLLDRSATLASGSHDRAALCFSPAVPLMEYAQKHGMAVRFHVLVWHNQTPRWFFAKDWAIEPDAPLADRETIIRRMENSIADTMTYVNQTWPGLVYAWDVVNEAIEPDHKAANMFRTKSLWYQTLGEDFVSLAFRAARKYQTAGQQLYYNDFSVAQPDKYPWVYALVKRLADEGVIDGVGMQTHIGMDYPDFADYERAIREFAALGLTLQVTEMDIRVPGADPASQMKLGVRYRDYFAMMRRLRREGLPIDSITLWGLADDHSWLMGWNGPTYPLFFDGMLRPKPAFFGALLDEAIPASLDAVDLPSVSPIEQSYKPSNDHNPVMTQRFGADPWAMPYDGRVYLYMTGDFYTYGDDGSVGPNRYGTIDRLRCISSADLVNWTDHGDILAAGPHGAAKWARNSWAPAAAHKNVNGREKFFLYFADSGNGIGVLEADSPAGPFRDPLGHALINRATPNCADVTWLFDPAVLVDDDGRAYIYVGGGVPEGRAADPGTARCCELGPDMISLNGEPVAFNPPYLFEDSGIVKAGSKYIFSYCTNFSVPADAPVPFRNGEICTMLADSPLGPFVYADRVLKNPADYFGVGGNNHHCMFRFRDQWYIAYHTQTLERAIGLGSGYRCTFIDKMDVEADGHIAMIAGTRTGVPQVQALDPYQDIPATTAAVIAGVTMQPDRSGMVLYTQVANSWSMLSGVNFGTEGANSLTVRYRSVCDGTVSIVLDNVQAVPTAVLPLSKAFGGNEVTLALPETITGTHNVYLVYSAPAFRFTSFRFHA